MNKWPHNIILFAIFFVTMVFMATIITVWLNKYTAPIQTEQKVVELPVQQVFVPSVDEKLDAMMRAFPNSLKICYDELGFLLYYGPLLKPGDKPDRYDRLRGWKFINHPDVPFHRLSNNTWLTVDFDVDKWVNIYPNVTGLTCKERE